MAADLAGLTMTSRRLGICMLSSKFYATSDMGGGLERSAHRLFQYLLGAGHRVVVLTRNYDGLPRQELIEGVMVYRFPVWGRSPVFVSLSYLIQSLWWMVRHHQTFQVIHGHQSYAPATIGTLAKFLLRKPVLVKISTADEFSELGELQRLPMFWFRRFLLRHVDRFVVVNRHACEELIDFGICASKVVHIPNGVLLPQATAFEPAAKQAARSRLKLPEGRMGLFVGRLSAEKNLSVLLDAWQDVVRVYPSARLWLLGDGGTFRSVELALRRQVEACGLQEHVQFAGRVAEVHDFLLAADVFVLPSSTEGMSNALLEAMAAGLPIVATRIPGNVELVRDGENGLLVDKQDAGALARAIRRLFDSPEEADRLGQAARRTVEERFVIQRVGQAYLSLYDDVLNSGARHP